MSSTSRRARPVNLKFSKPTDLIFFKFGQEQGDHRKFLNCINKMSIKPMATINVVLGKQLMAKTIMRNYFLTIYRKTLLSLGGYLFFSPRGEGLKR